MFLSVLRWRVRWFVVGALALSLGAHWFVLQSFAWATMLVRYAQNDSLSTAVSKTFDGKHPCKLCNFVREGKKAEKPLDVVKVESDKKFVSEVTLSIPPPPSNFTLLPETNKFAQARSQLPLLPPPRGHFA